MQIVLRLISAGTDRLRKLVEASVKVWSRGSGAVLWRFALVRGPCREKGIFANSTFYADLHSHWFATMRDGADAALPNGGMMRQAYDAEGNERSETHHEGSHQCHRRRSGRERVPALGAPRAAL